MNIEFSKCPKCLNGVLQGADVCNYCGHVLFAKDSLWSRLWRVFVPAKSRINRKEYLIAVLGWTVFISVSYSLLLLSDNPVVLSVLAILLGFLVNLAFIIFVIFSIKRHHDFGESGWGLLWNLFFPMMIPFTIIYLLLKRGDQGINKYG